MIVVQLTEISNLKLNFLTLAYLENEKDPKEETEVRRADERG